jgi:hypothetical protein
MTFEIPSDVTAGLAQMERWNLGNAKVELSGTKEVMENLSHILVVAEDRAIARLKLNCERILAKSDQQVPVDMTYETRYTNKYTFKGIQLTKTQRIKRRGRMRGGLLRSTGTVEDGEDGRSFNIGYNTPYAHRQHEDLTYRHTRPGAKAKYLEDPAMEIAPTIAADIAEALKEVLV